MKGVLGPVRQWLADGQQVAVGRVVEVVGSGVRPAGAAIAVNGAGDVVGSASGGCVEGALVEEARAVLAAGGKPRLLTFGCSDDEAFDVGLTCGGLVRVLLERLEPGSAAWVDELHELVDGGDGAAMLEVVDGPEALLGGKAIVRQPGEPGPAEADATEAASGYGPAVGGLPPSVAPRALADALEDLAAERSAPHTYRWEQDGVESDVTVFVDAYPAPPEMLIVGAASFTAALTAQAKLLGYRVVVCDARSVFASASRFPMADEVVVDWADRYLARRGAGLGPRDAICILTHDPKFDMPAIQAAVRTGAGYIGVMGSRRTQADRRRRLLEAGLGEAQVDRLRGPLGLDLGAGSPEETAVSICAEIIALRHGRSGVPLATSDAPIHPLTAPTLAGLEGALAQAATGEGHRHA